MIMRFLKKIPAGMMVVPMLLGAIINTFLPEVTNIGSFTTAVFTSAGANTAIGIQLFCLGTTLRVRDMGGVVKRGGVLLISKFVIGAAIGEWLGAQSGLGYFSRRMMTQLDGAGVFAPIVLLSAAAILAVAVVNLLEKRFVRWRGES